VTEQQGAQAPQEPPVDTRLAAKEEKLRSLATELETKLAVEARTRTLAELAEVTGLPLAVVAGLATHGERELRRIGL